MKANRLLTVTVTVTVAVLGVVWGLADELDGLFPKSNRVVAEGRGVKITRLELDAAVKFSLMNAAAEDVSIAADIRSLEEQLLHELVFSRLAAVRATQTRSLLSAISATRLMKAHASLKSSNLKVRSKHLIPSYSVIRH